MSAPTTPDYPGKRHRPSLAFPVADRRAVLARQLDLMAGCELQHGHHLAAEHLARQAQALREVGQ